MYRITFIAHANGRKLCHLLFVLFYGHCMLYCLCHWIESITPCVMDHAISDVFTSVNYDLHPQYTIHIKLYHLRWMDGWMEGVWLLLWCAATDQKIATSKIDN